LRCRSGSSMLGQSPEILTESSTSVVCWSPARAGDRRRPARANLMKRPLDIALIDSVHDSSLQERLDLIFAGIRERDVTICTCSKDRTAFASVGSQSGRTSQSCFVSIGCVTKLLTAAVLEQLLAERILTL